MAKRLRFIIVFCLLILKALAQAPDIEWQRSFEGVYAYSNQSIQQTEDGGYIVAGHYERQGNYNNYTSDFWITKLDKSGITEWQKFFGGSGFNQNESYPSIQQTTDGGYIIAGSSYGGDGAGMDYWVIKLDGAGNMQWQKTFGGSGTDWASSVRQTVDGGFIAAGRSMSNDGDVTGNHGGYDFWIVKLNESGSIQWQRSLGGSHDDWASSVWQTADEGFIIAGRSMSNDGDVSGNHGYEDCWVIKLDKAGNIQWQKCYGGSALDRGYSIQQTEDRGFIVAGTATSKDGDLSDHNGDWAYWVLKLDESGDIQWQKTLGASRASVEAYSIQETGDGGYIVTGSGVTGNYAVAKLDYSVIKLDESGNIQWQKSLGGSEIDISYSVIQTTDGGYVVAGYSMSNDGNVIRGNQRDYPHHCWIVKLRSSEEPTITITSYTNPDKKGCETGSFRFKFESNSGWFSLTVRLYHTPTSGPSEPARTINLNYPQDSYQFSNLKAGTYKVLVNTNNGDEAESAFVTLVNPAPSPEAQFMVISKTDVQNYGCNEGAVRFSFSSPDCWQPATVHLIPVAPFAGNLPSIQLNANGEYTLQEIPARKYKLRLVDNDLHTYDSEEFEIQHPSLSCSNLSVTSVLDDSRYSEACQSKVTLSLNTGSICPQWWKADIGAGLSATSIDGNTIEYGSNTPLDNPIIFNEVFRFPADHDALWYAFNIEVIFDDNERCSLPAQVINVPKAEPCTNNPSQDLSIQIVKEPEMECSKDGVVRAVLNKQNTCDNPYGEFQTEYYIRLYGADLEEYSSSQIGDKTLLFENLPAGAYMLQYGYNLGKLTGCTGQTSVMLSAKGTESQLRIWPNPSVFQDRINYEVSTCSPTVILTLNDMNGLNRYSFLAGGGPGTITGFFPVLALPAGIYVITAYTYDGQFIGSVQFFRI